MAMKGGLARDGWYVIGIGKKKLLRDGVPATATIRSFALMDEASNVGNAQHDFTLDVQREGDVPYSLQGLFRIPVRLIPSVEIGMQVPVKVHPENRNKVAIDWDAWETGRSG